MAAPDPFDSYFRRADADGDGRISGQEAISFFQGANLSREILAKIWQYADQRQSGFLSRPEFYNALKLVTVAQTGRELTPAIVRSALQGSAASQIPPPQIQMTTGPIPAQVAMTGRSLPSSSFPMQQFPQYNPTGPQGNSLTSQPGAYFPSGPQVSSFTAQPRAPNPQTTVTSSGSWSGPTPNNGLMNQNLQVKAPSTGPIPSNSIVNQSVQVKAPGVIPTPQGVNNTNVPIPKSASLSSIESGLFGGDIFTVAPVKQNVSGPQLNSMPNLSVPLSQPNAVATTMNLSAAKTSQHKEAQFPNPSNPPSFALVPTTIAPAGTSNQMQPLSMSSIVDSQSHGFNTADVKNWPKMTNPDVQRYAKIFFEVDSDKDGKINGMQARDLFLSWKIPREILKQIWDLSDQDRDSMLSLREFCLALYIMERHRDGLKLPTSIQSDQCFDESGIQALRIAEARVLNVQNSAAYNASSWQNSGALPQGNGRVMSGLPPRPVPVRPGFSPSHSYPASTQVSAAPKVDGQQKSRAPILEMNFVNQLSADDQLTLQTKHQEAVDAEKKVLELEKEIMDSKEKMEYYRSKLQDIVLFKTRCDNRLNEITERASADKREVESLAKKYDEKFKQAGESQSRLLADELAFRDIQERRLELYNAIIRMEQGGNENALLQSRADRLHNDLDELRKALNAKCKQMSLRIKPTSLLEMPYGWQPGMQENAAEWDDDWDKFQDEGFTYIQEFMEEGSAGADTARSRTITTWDDDDGDGEVVDALGNGEHQTDETESSSPQAVNGSSLDINGDNGQPVSTPLSSKSHEQDLFSDHAETTTESNIFNSETNNNETGDDWASVFKNDDMDFQTTWGTNDTSSKSSTEKSNNSSTNFSDPFNMLASSEYTKDTGFHTQNSFGFNDPFDTKSISQDDLPSVRPIQTKERSSVFFDNSVPSTPLYNNTSPHRSSSGGFFDSHSIGDPFARFDSFNSSAMNDVKYSSSSLTRFDSFSSNINDAKPTSSAYLKFDSFSGNHPAGVAQASGLSFDDNDPFSGAGPFRGTKTNMDTLGSSS